MGLVTNGTFNVPGGFNIANPFPIDDRTLVEFLTDLTGTTTIPTNLLYSTIEIGVLETNKRYYWNGQDRTDIANWIEIGDCIKLTGTEPTKPVTGDIVIDNPDTTSKGIHSENYRPENYLPNTYVQKKYVDDAIAVEQEIPVGGIYNDMELEGNILVFTNNNAQAILKGFNVNNKYKIIYTINNGNFPIRVDNLDAGSLAENQFQLPNNDISIGLQGTSKWVYVEAINKWQLLDTYGSRYMPEHNGLNEDAVVVVGKESISKSKQTRNLFVFRDNQTTEMTNAQLTTAYPEAFRGVNVICPNIGTDGVIYVLINDVVGIWKKTTLTNTTL